MPTATRPTSRLVFLDWLRILAFGLLVVYHVGMFYVSWDFHLKSPHAGPALEPWMRLSSPWRMTLLFLVSGAATSFMLARQGASGTLLGQRSRRLLLPLLCGMLLVVPPQAYLEVQWRYGYDGSFFDFMRLYLGGIGSRPGFCNAGHCLILPTWNHLWFLPYLWLYTLGLWGLLRWAPTALDAAGAHASASLRGATLLLGPVLWFAGTRLALGGRYPITHALVDDPLAHAQYAAAFALGAVLARVPAVWPRFEALRWPALAMAVLAWATAARLGEYLPPAFSVQQWCAIVAALGFAHRHLQRDNAARRWLTEAVFPVYVLHQTVILLLAHGLAPWGLRPAVEGPLLIVGTFALCALGYFGVRRVALLRPWFGLSARSCARPAARSGKIAA